MMPPRNKHPSAEPPRNHARFVRTTLVPDSNANASHSDDSNANSARPTTAPPKTAPQLITGRVEVRTVARAGAIEISRAICILLSNDLLRWFPGPGSPTPAERTCDIRTCVLELRDMTEQMFELARRTFDTPEFRGITCIEVEARSVINKVSGGMPFDWTINP